MSSQEYIQIPKGNYVQEQPKSWGVLFDPTITEKVKQLTLRETKIGKDANSTVPQVAENQPHVVEKTVVNSLSMSKPGQLEKTKPILKKKYVGWRS